MAKPNKAVKGPGKGSIIIPLEGFVREVVIEPMPLEMAKLGWTPERLERICRRELVVQRHQGAVDPSRIAFGEYYDQQTTMVHPTGGMDAIPTAFARRLGRAIHYRHVVEEIRRTESGVRIAFDYLGEQGTVTANHAIVTIPTPVLRSIPNDFSPEAVAAIDEAQYSSAGKVAFQSGRFWESEEQIYGGITWTEQAMTQMWYPSAGFGAAEGVLVGAYLFGGEPGTAFADMSEEQRLEAALSQGERIHPQLRAHVHNGISRSWLNTPYSLGGWAETPPSEVWERADGPFIFAGDHTTHMSGWQEGALASAQRALHLLGAEADD